MNGDKFEDELQRQRLRPVPEEWREEILAAAREAGGGMAEPRRETWFRAGWLWRRWSFPRLAWGGLAAAWVAILVLNWAAHRPGGPGAIEPVYSPAVVAMALRQTQQLALGLERSGEDAGSRARELERPRSAGRIEERAV